ncbi:MAG TPA: hypothetical protein VGP30_00305, partial [Candidatus Limnocylindrales bacterium]|nr:hypothetical protein [Candidatus Limnocylindrales bacterium]
MSSVNRIMLALLCAVMLACSPSNIATMSPLPTQQRPAVLTIEGRGNPPVTIYVGAFEAARIACDGGGVVTPGEGAVPSLPWDLRAVKEADGEVLLSERVTTL